MKKKLFIIITLINIATFSFLYIQNIPILNNINSKIIDSFFLIRGEREPTNLVTIVNIDEASLKEFGQWPWKREILAQIVTNLKNSQAGIIGFDIFFPEKDNHSIINDIKFANSLKHSPSILGIMFDLEKNNTINTLYPIPAIFIQKNLKKEFLIQAKGYIANTPLLQKAAYSSGFVNMIPDDDGIVRAIPLIIKYKDNFYNSLAFELYRLSVGASKIFINYSEVGVDTISLNNKITFKTDRFGRIYLNYYGDKGKFRYISAKDIYYNQFDQNLIKNHFILIGTTAAGLFDLRATPFNSVFPGVEIQATLIDNLLQQNFLHKPDFVEAIDIFNIVLASLIIFIVIYKFSAYISFLISSLLGISYFIVSYLIFKNGFIIDIFTPFLAGLILFIILTSINYILEQQKVLKIKKEFAKKVSPKVMEEILSTKGVLEPKEKEITIFFSDIRSFTSISEKLHDPKKVISLLNTYFEPMSEIIISKEGTIDKFIGDAIMAYWNAPTDIKNHADKAIESAILQIKTLKKLNKTLQKNFTITLNIGIGINTGVATIGEIGSKGRSDYTAIGDSVNLASRLEGLNKFYKTNIIISEFTKNNLTKKFNLRELDIVKVKGKGNATKIFEVVIDNKEYKSYKLGLEEYRKQNLKKALELFEKEIEISNDEVSKIYAKRCKEILNKEKEFKLIQEFLTK